MTSGTGNGRYVGKVAIERIFKAHLGLEYGAIRLWTQYDGSCEVKRAFVIKRDDDTEDAPAPEVTEQGQKLCFQDKHTVAQKSRCNVSRLPPQVNIAK